MPHPNQCTVCGRFPFEACHAPKRCPRDAPTAAIPEPAPEKPVERAFKGAATCALGRDQQRQTARAKGYTGDACQECGNLSMVRNGTCLKCDTCGSTSGCS